MLIPSFQRLADAFTLLRRPRTRSLAIAAVLALAAGAAGASAATHAVLGSDLTQGASPAPADPGAAAEPSSSSTPALVGEAGAKNIVQVSNNQDRTLRAAGRVQLNQVPAPKVGPVNIADATSSCVDCQTLAVALQINLIGRPAVFTPQNAAVAVNGGCLRCHTVAVAYQYNIRVDDPGQVPPEVMQLVAQMKQELAALGQHSTLAEAEASADAVIAQYQDLAGSLIKARQEATAASPASPPPAASPAAAEPAAPAPTASSSPGSTTTPSATPDPTPTPSASPTPGPSPSPSPT